MSADRVPLELELPPAALEAIAQRVAQLLEQSNGKRAAGPWLTVDEAAERMRCSRQRVYDLVSSGRLRKAKDGSRSVFRVEWIDAYLEGEAQP